MLPFPTSLQAPTEFDARLIGRRHQQRESSQLCAKYGVDAASRALHQADLGITAQHYVNQKERLTFGMGNLLVTPSNVRSMPQIDGPPSAVPRGGGKRSRTNRRL
jgi:hypothetical protein